jgi:hypothetical protein
MTDYPGRRRNRPDDPTDAPSADPVPTGEDILNRYRHGHETPRRYEEPIKEHDSSSDEPTLPTQM